MCHAFASAIATLATNIMFQYQNTLSKMTFNGLPIILVCSWPYSFPSQDCISQKTFFNMSNQSILTLRSTPVDELICKSKEEACTGLKDTLTNGTEEGDLGPIGLESDEPSCPSSPCNTITSLENVEKDTEDSNRNLLAASSLAVHNDVSASKSLPQTSRDSVPSIFLSCAGNDCCQIESVKPKYFSKEAIAKNLIANETFDENNKLNHSEALTINKVKALGSNISKAKYFLGKKQISAEDESNLSAYYVPSTGSVFAEDSYSEPPIPPPRAARRFRREETQSEADASLTTKIDVSYKSLRSHSDPSTNYTRVIKPRAIKPSPPASNIDYVEHSSSLESMQAASRLHMASLLQQGQERRSAFRQHLRNESALEVSFLSCHSRSLEDSAPSCNDNAGGEVASFERSTTPARTCSLNDVYKNSELNCRYKCEATTSGWQPEQRDRSFEPNEVNNDNKDDNQRRVCNIDGKEEVSCNGKCSSNPRLSQSEPIHMTLEEVRSSLQASVSPNSPRDTPEEEYSKSPCQQFFKVYLRPKKGKKSKRGSSCEADGKIHNEKSLHRGEGRHRCSFPTTVKAAISSWFGLRRSSPTTICVPSKKHSGILKADLTSEGNQEENGNSQDESEKDLSNTSPFMHRALPPLPVENGCIIWGPTVRVSDEEGLSLLSRSSTSSSLNSESDSNHNRRRKMDYAASIQRVKDCGWYWGPISGETAEKLLSKEPDGSFLVRDSSDEHYIFSLTFKLNGWVRHVRIEHDQGNFSFGCQQKFHSNTIVDFIETAVEHSRSGRYLFFLHRRPVLGPMRVQLLHPVSRFKQVQSLQHLCRFVILKSVRRDLIDSLPLPRCLRDYLNTPHYYYEELSNSFNTVTGVLAGSIVAQSASINDNSSLNNIRQETIS